MERERRGFEYRERTFLIGFLQVFLGVFFGGLAAAFTYEKIVEIRLEWAARQVAEEVQKQTERSKAEAARMNLQREQARQQLEAEAKARQQAQDLAARRERERVERRETAWHQFFQPSPACRADSGTAQCANEYIAAKKRFAAQYIDRP